MTTKDALRLPPLDRPKITRDAEAWVEERIVDAAADEDVIAETTRIIDGQQPALERARARRDLVALSIREYGPDATSPVPVALRKTGLAEAAGVSKARLQTLRDQWPAGVAVTLVPDARQELPKAARAAFTHKARIQAARRIRDEAACRLLAAGWRNVDVANLMGRDRSRVAVLRQKHAPETIAAPMSA